VKRISSHDRTSDGVGDEDEKGRIESQVQNYPCTLLHDDDFYSFLLIFFKSNFLITDFDSFSIHQRLNVSTFEKILLRAMVTTKMAPLHLINLNASCGS
jgi:hypothetical protein